MRQFFSWRIWATIAALIGLTFWLRAELPPIVTAHATVSTPVHERRIDLMTLVYSVQPGPSFRIDKGVVSGSADFVIDGQRTMHIVAGTLGEITCRDYTKIANCVVVADLLGDAVIWFALAPAVAGPKIEAAPIDAVLDNGLVRLHSGWLVPAVTSIERRCPQETGSLAEFIRRFGPASTTIIDVAKQEVVAVQCAASVKPS